MPSIALFLGAGASRAFGYPTTKDFMNNLSRKLTGTQKEIFDIFTSPPEIKDIEHVLEALDSLIPGWSNLYLKAIFTKNPPQMPVRTNAKAKTTRTVNWGSYIASCRNLKERIIRELNVQYRFDPTRLDDILKYYNILVKMLTDLNIMGKLDIFTTNYDRVIEGFYINSAFGSVDLIDGFKSDPLKRGRFYNPEEFQREHKSSFEFRLRLFKLHGSLNWRETNDGRIENVGRVEERCLGTGIYKKTFWFIPLRKVSKA